jgi:Family of unknown function (DUF6533)
MIVLTITLSGLITVAQDVNLTRWVSGVYFFTPSISLHLPIACVAAAVTILVYDTLLTLGDEVRLIWPKRLSVIKVLTNLVSIFLPPPLPGTVANATL